MQGAKTILRAATRRILQSLLGVEVRCRPESLYALQRGRALVVSNHVSFLDGVLLAVFSPCPLAVTSEPAYSICNPWTSRGMRLLAWMGFGRVIPLDSARPFGVRAVVEALRAGENALLFPEGRISPDGRGQAWKPGFEWIVRASGCQVVQARILGAERSRLFAPAGRAWRPRITLEF